MKIRESGLAVQCNRRPVSVQVVWREKACSCRDVSRVDVCSDKQESPLLAGFFSW